jgi:hypothetical protein
MTQLARLLSNSGLGGVRPPEPMSISSLAGVWILFLDDIEVTLSVSD